MVPETGGEWHISSLVVHTRPAQALRVAAAIGALPDAEVHGLAAEQGKLVVTLEGPTSSVLLQQVDHIRQLDGVLATALVYQCADSLQAMNEEIPDAHPAQGLS